MNTIRVVITDDHPVVREGIKAMLSKAAEIEVIGMASSGQEALRMITELVVDVLLIDIEMPDLSGIEVARRLHEMKSSVRVLVLSAYDDKEYINALLASGAAGYLVKDEAIDTIVEAVRGVARGEVGWMSRRITAQIINISKDDSPSTIQLTPRELQILRLVVAGKANSEIGHALNISTKTVEKNLRDLFGKLNVASRTEAAVRAIRDKLLD